MRADAEGSRRFAEDGDVARVRAEARRVRPHPAQRRPLVREGETGRPAELRMAEQAEDAQPVVHGHDHDAALRGQPVGPVRVARAAEEAAAVEPDHDGPPPTAPAPGGGPARRSGDVEVQAVLRAGRPAGPTRGQLHTARTGRPGIAYALPARCRLRQPPAQRTGRGSGEGDPLEGVVRAVPEAPHRTPVGVHDGPVRTGGGAQQQQCDGQQQGPPATELAKVGHGRRPFPIGARVETPVCPPRMAQWAEVAPNVTKRALPMTHDDRRAIA